jgi:hypothetical protein
LAAFLSNQPTNPLTALPAKEHTRLLPKLEEIPFDYLQSRKNLNPQPRRFGNRRSQVLFHYKRGIREIDGNVGRKTSLLYIHTLEVTQLKNRTLRKPAR